ncbi:hypothetical protein MMG00_09950 [Ignatzschineria rhizosphaerae]|uniref:Secreted protein n=1 Tax=Ignatzschineria rhizosphaerae TaxID=2923279 RepID=A0ABY3WY49_9GAMM|nr:hypothetical protein [Ignatzschineria rhizosphaerae]UNM95543.1 hypothetical protein MMG00_09950 [Ignatzschineria rhizosphaerae]
MNRYLFKVFIFFSIFISSFSFSQVVDGRYLGAGSESDVIIETNDIGQQRFLMNILGGNGHVCFDVAGTIKGNQGLVDDEEELGQCELTFTQKGHILDVNIETYEECRQYCGMRATLEGSYRIPPQACTLNAIALQRQEFQALYDQKQYKDAENILNKLLNQCNFYLDFVAYDAIRNDLALTLYHQDAPELCIEVLTSTIAVDQNAYLPPMEQELYEEIEKAILFNWELCGGE